MRVVTPFVVTLALAALGSCRARAELVPRAAFDAALTAACGAGGVTPQGEARLLRPPYLQQVTERSAELLWTAKDDAQYAVEVRGPDGDVRRFAARVDESARVPGGAQFVARLDGLRPDTAWCYRVVAGDGALVESTGFRTAPAPGAGQAIRFIALGDLGEASAFQRAVAARMGETPFDFAVVTGDIAYPRGSLASYEKYFFKIYAHLLRKVPFFVASGNHDRNTGPDSAFAQVFSLPDTGGNEGREKWYSFDWGPAHFAVLDTERIGKTQARWLDRDLEASRAPWKIVVGHRPPFSGGAHGDDEDVQRWFLPVLEKHAVPLALWGHDHHYERMRPVNGVTHIVTGGGGKDLRRVRPTKRTVVAEPVAHFTHVTIDGDELVAYAVDSQGRTIDEVRLGRPQPTVATSAEARP